MDLSRNLLATETDYCRFVRKTMEFEENEEIADLRAATSDLLKVSRQSLMRVKQLEEAVLLLKDIVLRHDEAHDEQRTVNDDFMFKMNALIDAQIRENEGLKAIKDRLNKLEKNGDTNN